MLAACSPISAEPLFDVTDFKIIQFVAGFKGCNEPPRSFPSAGPCFRWRQGITVFGQNLWILAARRAITDGQWISVSGLPDDVDPI